jgi:putative two-component system response regulator
MDNKLQNALIKTMAELVDYHDNNTGDHIERTQLGMRLFLEEMEKDHIYEKEIKKYNKELLLQSCLLYDVGKISVKEGILNKAGRLTDEEFSEMKKHVFYGEKIIDKIEKQAGECDFTQYAKTFVTSHHEKWDGTGYPRGLKEKEIPLLGRIMAIIDVYEALTSVRPYKGAFTHEQAVEIIVETAGTVFDPDLVEVFELTSDKFKKS